MQINYKEIFEEMGITEESLNIVFNYARIKCYRDISIITDLHRYSFSTEISKNTWDLICFRDTIQKAMWESIGIPKNLFGIDKAFDTPYYKKQV